MKNRFVAVTFGYGKALLSPASLEADFGLRTALHLASPGTLRAVDYRTIEERTRIGRVQLSDEGSVGAFRMDFDTDLLRGLEARCKDTSVCERIAAKWSSLTVVARVAVDGIPRLAGKLLRTYSKRSLPDEFKWIDHVRRVNDQSLAGQLEGVLTTRLDQSLFTGVRLAIPEIRDNAAEMITRLFDEGGPEFSSDIGKYLAERPRTPKNTVDAMKRSHSVVLMDAGTGAVMHRESLFRCVVAEIEYQGELYLLADGEWFALDRDFVKDVNTALAGVPVLKHGLPAWKSGEPEGGYNSRACGAWKDAALLDKSNLRQGGGQSQIEPADWVSLHRMLGYVKRRDKNSQGLSHLFAQGSVAAEVISRDRSYRGKVAAKLPKSHAALAKELQQLSFDPRSWTIAFVILGANKASPADGLPFFSKVNLRKHVDRLKSMQFHVGLIGV